MPGELRLFTNTDFYGSSAETQSETLKNGLVDIPNIPEFILTSGNIPLVNGCVDVTTYREQVTKALEEKRLVKIPKFLNDYAMPVENPAFGRYQEMIAPFRQKLLSNPEYGYNFNNLVYRNSDYNMQWKRLTAEEGKLTHLACEMLYQDSVEILGEKAAYELMRWEVLQDQAHYWLNSFNPTQSSDPLESPNLMGGTGLPLRGFLLLGLLEMVEQIAYEEHQTISPLLQAAWEAKPDPRFKNPRNSQVKILGKQLVGIAGGCYGAE